MATGQVPLNCDFVLETIFRPLVAGTINKPVFVESIHINNALYEDYHITFQIRRTNANSVGILYDFQLLAGYILEDDTVYHLDENSTIWAKSDKTTVNVTINGYKEILTT